MIENITSEIVSCIKSYHPIIYITSNDENRIDQVLKESFSKINDYKTFKIVPHYRINFDNSKIEKEENKAPDFIINSIEDLVRDKKNIHALFVLHNMDKELKDKKLLSVIKNTSLKTLYNDDFRVFFFIVSPVIEIPKELEQLTTVINIPNPDEQEIKMLINNLISTNLKEVNIDNTHTDNMITSLKGLTEIEIKKIINFTFQKRGIFDDKSIKEIVEQKKQIIKKSNLLELIENTEKNIGGVKSLITWLERKKRVFEEINQGKNLPSPKGCLLVGVPGSGKSLAAQAAASIFKQPLLKLELGKILNKYVGESESNFHEAIRLAEAMSPCVLWIDELEKAFVGAGSGNDSNGTTTRIFGFFLTWLQEKTKPIFIIATANNISNIPPEFSRKGRFDKIFYMGCPKKDQIPEIFKIHFKKRDYLDSKLKTFLDSEDFKFLLDDKLIGVITGSDIESIVQESIEDNFIEGEKFYGRDLKFFLERRIKEFSNSPNLEEKRQKIESDKQKLFSQYDVTGAN